MKYLPLEPILTFMLLPLDSPSSPLTEIPLNVMSTTPFPWIFVPSFEEKMTYEISVYGDVSGDGKVSIKDVYMIADYAVATSENKESILSSAVQLIAADVNTDDRISISDVFRVADYAINPSKGF